MTIQVYRDVACADGAALFAELVFRLTANGFAYVAHGTGTAGARVAVQPATAADLATALRTAPNSWVCVSRGSRAFSWQRGGAANPSYTSWKYEYTASGALTVGSATAPDRNAANSQLAAPAVGGFLDSAPSTGGVADAMKVHILVDDAGPSFAAIARRTPLPAGNVGAFSINFADLCVDPVWAANPDPMVVGCPSSNGNSGDASLFSQYYNAAWVGYTLPSPSWAWSMLENPGSVAGNTTPDRGGVDVMYEARWVTASPSGAVIGKSSLFRLLQPGRTPVVGIDAGGTLTHAAFWSIAVLNDGIALTS